MKQRQYSGELTPDMDGKRVRVAGWVSEIRVLGGIAFVTIRDRAGFTQVTFPKKKVGELFNIVHSLYKESVVEAEGTLKANKEAPRGVEVIPEKFEVVSPAQVPLPMDVSGKIESELETRLDSRFMDLRQPKVLAVFLVRDAVTTAIRDYVESKDFIEVHTPKIVATGAEGGATLFPVDYFGKPAYLAQSPQLFKQSLMATGLDRVYEIGPAFRAEPSATTKHLSEFTSFDFEMAFIESKDDVMDTLEDVVIHTYKHVQKHCQPYLAELGVELEVPEKKFPRLPFHEVKEALAKKRKNITDDLDSEAEKLLGAIMEKEGHEFYFITDFPEENKPFYIMENGAVSESFDLDFKGVELASGGQREHRYEQLIKRMQRKGLREEDFAFYLNSFKYGMPPHGGVGVGVDRFVQKMLNLSNVRETVLFPRDRIRLIP
ncbi:MAG: aspartate--tRNA(Asn) ligase [Candidatus Diapherotrites archaeon]|nr:aspartate--tRNA(Asn) ligase [Candidatus Diapherotrites archaeon]